MKCIKCGNDDVKITYREKREEYEGNNGSGEFVATRYEGYYITSVKKEHLACLCRTCGYFWRENTNDNHKTS